MLLFAMIILFWLTGSLFDIENGEAVITEAAVKVNGQTFAGDVKVLLTWMIRS